ncbi:hypothetical protein BDQ17DRAFT_1350271 [Cyathus striatus]|nr:hypothetical protein BDQ17DRAFT_1350271 [Cyathus striatus]
MHFSLGRMYTNALLVTLNARRSLRSRHHPTSFTTNSSTRGTEEERGPTRNKDIDHQTQYCSNQYHLVQFKYY